MDAFGGRFRHILLVIAVLGVAAVGLSLCACSAGQGGEGASGPAGDGGSSPAVSSAPVSTSAPASADDGIPADSILRFEDAADATQLVADMAAGRMPAECDVLYDTMGARPAVTVDDPETIAQIYSLLSQVTVEGPSNRSITDSYHHVRFTLQDGTVVGYSFEGEDLLCLDRGNYAVSGTDPLWTLVRSLQDEVMGEA